MQHRYHLVDVFTDEPLAGNQLAVFLEGADVEPTRMQRLAAELQLSETVFCLPHGRPLERRTRIFTPRVELPFAGHPTLGTAHVLTAMMAVPAVGEPVEWTLHQGAGPVRVEVSLRSASVSDTALTLEREPSPPCAAPSRTAVAASIGLDPDELFEDPAYSGLGVLFLMVPVRRGALARARFDGSAWAREVGPTHEPHLALFTPEQRGERDVRVFAPAAGIAEDPATGSAAAALAAHLLRRGSDEVRCLLRQGDHMGRPSRLRIEARGRHGAPPRVRVGGAAVSVGRGAFELP